MFEEGSWALHACWDLDSRPWLTLWLGIGVLRRLRAAHNFLVTPLELVGKSSGNHSAIELTGSSHGGPSTWSLKLPWDWQHQVFVRFAREQDEEESLELSGAD